MQTSPLASTGSEFDANPRANPLLVLQFDSNGRHSYITLTRNGILDIIRRAEEYPPDMQTPISAGAPNAPIFTKNLKYSTPTVQQPISSFCDLQPVHMRDLRQLDESFSESSETSIIVRQQAILFNSDPIRAVVLRDRTLVLVPAGADSLLSLLIHSFDECAGYKGEISETPYEFRALEAILDTLSRLLQDEYDRYATEISATLDSLANVRAMSGELETMRLMKSSVNEFEAQVDSIRRALMDLLNNEEDLRLLYLTKLWGKPSLIYDLDSFDPEEVEILLEAYAKDIYSTRTKVDLLQHRIQYTESLVTMKLDYTRNYLLALQLIFSLIGVGLGIGTLISGIFGMNLKYDVPNTESTFWWVIGSIVLGCMVVIWGGVAYFRQQGLLVVT